MRDYKGRRKGSRNNGYFFRDGRGWFTKENGRFVALTDKDGQRLRDKSGKQAAKDAYARYLVERGEQPKQATGAGVTLEEVCDYYLARATKGKQAIDG